MAGPGMNILPQYQGDYYTLQNKQALAQALMQQSLQPQQIQATGSGPYTVMPKYSMGAGIAQLGQALMAAKMQQQVAQGYQGLGQNQMNFLMGGGQPAPAASGVGGSPDGTTASAGPAQADPQALAGALAASGGAPQQGQPQPQAQPQAQQQPQQAQGGGGLLAPGSAMNPSGMDVGKAAFLYQTMGPEAYAKEFVAPYTKPTDATLMGRQAGLTPQQIQGANAGALTKSNFIAPITGTGTFRDPITMKPVAYNAQDIPGTRQLYDAAGNSAGVAPLQGAQAAMQGNAAATAAGEGSQLPYDKAVDVNGNPLPITNRTAVANQAGATTPASAAIVQTESGGNPNAVSPKGATGAWQVMPNTKTDPGFGVTPAANNSPAELNRVGKDYYNAMTQRYGSPTVGAIAYNMGPGATDSWLKSGGQFEQLPAETRNYVGKVATLTALNSGAVVPQGASGAAYGAAPLGAVSNANTAQQASADSMKASYGKLQSINSTANGTLDSLQKMQALAANKNSMLTAGTLGTAVAPIVSPDAAEYEKQRANVIQLLAAQNGTNGSNEGRSLTGESVPDYGKPKAAIQDGLQTQINQVRAQQLKTNVLTPVYQSGDSKAYTTLENQFDQTVKPSMMPTLAPILQLSGPQQQAAVQAAVKANSSLKPTFQLLFNAGMLK